MRKPASLLCRTGFHAWTYMAITGGVNTDYWWETCARCGQARFRSIVLGIGGPELPEALTRLSW